MTVAPLSHYDRELAARVRAIADGLTYRAGWRFSFHEPASIVATWEVDDVDDPGRTTLLQGAVTLQPLMFDADDAIARLLFELFELVAHLEAHERIELLRVNGRTLTDPHPAGAGRELVVRLPYPLPLPEGV